MTPNRLLVLAVAAALVVGVGVAAGTLESSVESTPDDVVEISTEAEDSSAESTSDDVVDVEASSIPIESEEIAEYGRQFESGGPENAETGGKQAASDGESAGQDAGSGASSEPGSGAQGPSDGDGDLKSHKRGPGEEQTSGEEDQSPLEELLELLRSLLAALGSLLPGIAVLAGAAAVTANRDRLAGLVGGDRESGGRDDAPGARPAPTNDVARAWYELARLAGVEEVETTTPRQCATAAVEAGADRSAVERLTRAFEEVRYGDRAVTEERREQARDGLGAER